MLMNQYEGRLTLYHIDLYRLDSLGEITDLGLEEYLYSEGVCVVEWAEKAPGIFPEEHLSIQIDRLGENTRQLTLTAYGGRYTDVLDAVEKRAVKS